MRTSRSSMQRVQAPRGFTLIELLAVLAIVAVLVTLVVPRYYGQVDAAKESVLRENLRATRDVLDHFYGDAGRYPDSLQELVDRRYIRSLPMDPLTDSTVTWVVIPPPEGYQGSVYNLHSGSTAMDRNGRAYADW